MKSIRAKILSGIFLLVTAASVSVGGVASFLNYRGTMNSLKQTTVPAAKMAGEAIAYSLQGYITALVEAAATDTFQEERPTSTQIIKEGEDIAQRNGFKMVGKTDLSGNSSHGSNIMDRDYFQLCKTTKEPVISDLVISKADNTQVFTFAAPILIDGKFSGIVYGTADANFLSEIVNGLKLGNTGIGFVLDNKGNTIAHINKDSVINQTNMIEQAKTDPSVAALGQAHSRMAQGETDFTTYSYNGTNKILAFAPVPIANGWSVGIAADQSEFLKNMQNGILITIALALTILIFSILLAFRIAKSVSDPIQSCVKRLIQLEEGDLMSPVPAVKTKDETFVLLNTLRNTIDGMKTMIGDASQLLEEMANGNFDVQSSAEGSYKGDFESLKTSVHTLTRRMDETLSQINLSADQVANGANQVSGGAQALSQGATEQASSVQELAATINELSGKISENAQSIDNARGRADTVKNEALESNQRMKDMLSAMDGISKSSSQIAKIMKTIEDIAFQTNILALNAAVEAARAGVAGKGFAVVADEVRSLASKSAEASKNTGTLIETSLHAVETGTKIASETADSMETVVQGIQDVAQTVGDISSAFDAQAQSLEQITTGVDQISSVVQTNSATAEESAAASEELSGQAEILKNLVGQFRLKNSSTDYAFPEEMNTL